VKNFLGVGGFPKILRNLESGSWQMLMSDYKVGGWGKKGQKLAYVIFEWSLTQSSLLPPCISKYSTFLTSSYASLTALELAFRRPPLLETLLHFRVILSLTLIFETNCSKLIKIGSNLFKLDQIGSLWIKLV
jgi:hypothetical protein